MTTEIEGIKTNEFLRRRKLRLQQVREQSKDIAKKIRQRANVEKLRQVAELDSKKEKEYFQRQEKLVKRLEELYAKGVRSVGAGHKQAVELTRDSPEKTDLSKQRGREATAELRKKKQEHLDEQKKILDRKLQARETANELSREKSTTIANKILAKTSGNIVNESKDKSSNEAAVKDIDNNADKEAVKSSDMATQWEFDVMPNEWEPAVPILTLPKDDSEKESLNINNNESKSDKSKRIDLFALSEEMPSSLRGGLAEIPEERIPIKPSFTLVSEYLQSRGLRLRDTERTSNKPSGDLHSLKQTIMRSRPSKTEGSVSSDVCHVLDEQVIPVPSWQAEPDCHFCSHKIAQHYGTTEITVTNSQINKIFSSIRSTRDLLPSPVLRGSSPFKRNKVPHTIPELPVKGKTREKSPSNLTTSSVTTKKNLVTVYNHSTRDSRNIPCEDDRFVVHNTVTEEDAYSQALKEKSVNDAKEREHQQRLQEMRSKIAMTKQNVEKEYNDTLSFLNSLPKEKGNKTIKTAYMDERREKMLKDNRQHKLQQEFRKIEKECRKHGSMSLKRRTIQKHGERSKSPETVNNDEARDFQYSWMPVPESDGNLAIHTIPTSTKPKSGNSVKFSKVDSYHEYRSRHKHTPPTKEVDQERPKRVIETVLIQNDSECSEPTSSDTSSVENLGLDSSDTKNNTKNEHDGELTDAERIIIYKVLDSKKKQKAKKKAKLLSTIAKSLHSIHKEKPIEGNKNDKAVESNGNIQENTVSFEHIQEGIYKTTKEKGDNITSLYFADSPREGQTAILTENETFPGRPGYCNKDQQYHAGADQRSEKRDKGQRERELKRCMICQCGCVAQGAECAVPPAPQPSAATSTSSFRTAATDKENAAFPEGIVKLVDDEGQEAGKFYIGASGFLKDDNYEVIIQLRKKDSSKEEKKSEKQANERLYPINEASHSEDPSGTATSTGNVSEIKENAQSANDAAINITSSTEAVKKTKTDDLKGIGAGEKCQVTTSTEDLHQNLSEKIISMSNFGKFENSAVDEAVEDRENNCTEKGVGTSFHLSYAIPHHVTRIDIVPKAATSTYTQTTLNSPTPRPAYIHMSSSTSTAYMSPPEVLLPRALRRDSDEDTKKAFDSEYDKLANTNQCRTFQDRTCDTSDKVPCRKKCRCAKKVVPTPPNYTTASELPYDDIAKTKAHRCRRCESSKSQGPRNKINVTAKRRTSLPKHTALSVASSSKLTRNLKKKDDTNFNPLIKNYVNRLLTLNKEGVKALEVANQECSSVATPGSSIIDVPRNSMKTKTSAEPKLSLEQIKNELIKKILTDYMNKSKTQVIPGKTESETNHIHIKVSAPRLPKKRSIHKVKSLNISKRVLINNKSSDIKKPTGKDETTNSKNLPSEPQAENIKPTTLSKDKVRSKSSPTPRQLGSISEYKRKSASDVSTKCSKRFDKQDPKLNHQHKSTDCSLGSNKKFSIPVHRATSATGILESISAAAAVHHEDVKDNHAMTETHEVPITISTQTSRDTETGTNYVQLAEDKLQNMEKIADLTEKCTQRLTNLAKVLQEVRKNKSLAYSQISSSDSTSDVDQHTDKKCTNINSTSGQFLDIYLDAQTKLELKPSTPVLTSESEDSETLESSKYVSFLTDIPKPLSVAKLLPTEREIVSESRQNTDDTVIKSKTRPPPALSRLHLRHGQGYMTPHELSTVVEVDSPMSVRLKNQSSRENKTDMPDSTDQHCQLTSSSSNKQVNDAVPASSIIDNNTADVINPDLLQSNLSLSRTKLQPRRQTTDSSDDSKLQMMDLKQFNEIMLQPFISIQEYAKQYDIGTVDEASNLDDVPKDVVTEDLSSMQSDSSLPDVIAELLKRKVITEPFKYDTVSNIHSTTGSSESSVLALSKARKEKRKQTVVFQDKENIAESSDTLSFSSNPDLENAFKKLGMGWASSTLKKTKERLALSSSSNTSSSSISQFKVKSSSNQDIPALVSDSVSTIMHLTRKDEKKESKNNGQQTNMIKSMTVKEFLTNELANKITFTNKSRRDDTEEEFVSLFETKMPEEMKHSSQMAGERSVDSRAGENRARTSTPVQIYQSLTYRSSSSSNMSNGLFSNADDLSSVKVTSNSIRNHSTSDKDDLTIPNCSLRIKKSSDASKSD